MKSVNHLCTKYNTFLPYKTACASY